MSERLSAWIDGEFESGQTQELLDQLKHDGTRRNDWCCYHLIGDTLRGVHGPDFSAQILDQLNSEPTVLVPRTRISIVGLGRLGRLASIATAGVAALAFVGVVSWVNLRSPQQNSPETAANRTTEFKQVAVEISNETRDYLLAHQQYSPANSMQGLRGYVRAISLEFTPARRLGDQRRCDCQ